MGLPFLRLNWRETKRKPPAILPYTIVKSVGQSCQSPAGLEPLNQIDLRRSGPDGLPSMQISCRYGASVSESRQNDRRLDKSAGGRPPCGVLMLQGGQRTKRGRQRPECPAHQPKVQNGQLDITSMFMPHPTCQIFKTDLETGLDLGTIAFDSLSN